MASGAETLSESPRRISLSQLEPNTYGVLRIRTSYTKGIMTGYEFTLADKGAKREIDELRLVLSEFRFTTMSVGRMELLIPELPDILEEIATTGENYISPMLIAPIGGVIVNGITYIEQKTVFEVTSYKSGGFEDNSSFVRAGMLAA
mgnify:FL=1